MVEAVLKVRTNAVVCRENVLEALETVLKGLNVSLARESFGIFMLMFV